MSLDTLLKPVLSQLPLIRPEDEVEVLQELPVETLYLALKEADGETAMWLLENAQPNQVQGIMDLDCWDGSEFKADRALLFFENMALLEAPKLFIYMKEVDPEFVVRCLMELCEVQDYDPQNPPEQDENGILLSPDNKYALLFKNAEPQHQEAVRQWLDKLSSTSLDLMRRHLESCKWEQISDLEEFAYQIKKGRLEDMGFVDYYEAIGLYGRGTAISLKEKLIQEPLDKDQKLKVRSYEDYGDGNVDPADIEMWLPKPIKGAILGSGFVSDCIAMISSQELKEVLLQEILRSVNAGLSADRVLHLDLEQIRKSSERARKYLDLGLSYLAEGNRERGALMLERQSVSDIHRLGWLCAQDLVAAALTVATKASADFFPEIDAQFLQSLQGRHPELNAKILKDLGATSETLIDLASLLKAGQRLAHMSALHKYFAEDLAKTLQWNTQPRRSGESFLARLITALFRQSCSGNLEQALDVTPLSSNEWLTLIKNFDEGIVAKGLSMIVERAPQAAQAFLQKRVSEALEDLAKLAKNSKEKAPDPRFTKVLVLE